MPGPSIMASPAVGGGADTGLATVAPRRGRDDGERSLHHGEPSLEVVHLLEVGDVLVVIFD